MSECGAPAPPPPAGTAEVFEAALPAVLEYARLLCSVAVPHGLLGPREAAVVWCRHILNCATVRDLPPPFAHVVDLGAGAGLPGLVLAMARPDIQVCLVEAQGRRVRFLAEAIERLGLPNAELRHCRAENLSLAPVELVTARAVGPLPRVAAWAVPLLKPGGRLVVLRGDAADRDVAESRESLHRLGLTRVSVSTCGPLGGCPPTRIVLAEAGRTQSRDVAGSAPAASPPRASQSPRCQVAPRPRRRPTPGRPA